ncbi:myb-like protein A [Panonychus citri]|uniref:myb-like protein A n=1 Tax=Panonychus citri TaxID=50023 RepID=UPI0023072ED3|nr:myb-like protein A [Panonychus citri]
MINPIPTGSSTIKSSERLTNQRPRKRDCNVLKFHNFVPNKELSCFSRTRGSSENVLTGHCLKEENGSKQINVCNWQKKQQQSTPIKSDKNDFCQQSIQLLSQDIPMIYNDTSPTPTIINNDDLTSQSILGSLLARNEINRVDNQSNHIDDLISNYTVINVGGSGRDNINPGITINGNYGFLMPTTTTTKSASKINRRKPSTVRRFLRSSESPSNCDADEDNCDYDADESANDSNHRNQDEPLDLSTARKRPLLKRKTLKDDQCSQLFDYLPVLIPGTQITSQQLPQTMMASFLPYLFTDQQQQQSILTPTPTTITSVNSPSTPNTATGIDPMVLLRQSKLLLPHLSNDHHPQQQQHIQHRIPIITSADLTNSSPSSSSSSISSISSSNHHLHHSSRGSTSTIPGVGHFKVHNNNSTVKNHQHHIAPHHHHHHHLNRNNQNGPSNERNTIKAKLENEFRTNGFLVKTKEVSDGEATFCKFRQLRKYTRYYLKSWHQHLPDEINKLWKGFLPPKTSKPSSSSSSSSSSLSSSATINLTNNQPLDQSDSSSLSKQMTLNEQPMDIISSVYQSSS